MSSRKLVLVALLAAGGCPRPRADVGPPGPSAFVYVGGFRPEIGVYRLDPRTAALTPVGKVDRPPAMPSFMTFSASHRFAYSVDEDDVGLVVSFSIDPATGMLTRLNQASAAGVGPTYISLDRTGRWVFTASWAKDRPASISVNPLAPDGTVAPPVDTHTFPVNAHAHFITADPTNRYVIASISGADYLAIYKLDLATGKLTPNDPDRVTRPAGTNPRHMDFHPGGQFLYLINEHGCTVTAYRYDAAAGRLAELQDISTLPAGYAGGPGNSTAQVLVHPSGKFLYGSNRGHDSIVIYAIDQTSGKLTLVGFRTDVGHRPRNFTINPSGRYLLAAAQDDGTVTAYEIDPARGTLERRGGPQPVGDKPTFVGVLSP